jgi:hypothetical protein
MFVGIHRTNKYSNENFAVITIYQGRIAKDTQKSKGKGIGGYVILLNLAPNF